MNRRTAAEDFYFMQQLVKTGRVIEIGDTVVHPSARASQRVHLGTGFRMTEQLQNPDAPVTAYHPEIYSVLGRWLDAVRGGLSSRGSELIERAATINPELAGYLADSEFEVVWDALCEQHREPTNRLRAFHVWFDALRTLRLVHRLRDTDCPNVALGETAARLGLHNPTDDPKTLIDALRRHPMPPLMGIDRTV
jgi:hypothetical protein